MPNSSRSMYFSTIYNDAHPAPNLGEGTFYSVMRAVEWQDESLLPLKLSKAHDFSFIWHKVPDHRLIQIAEKKV